MHNNIHTPWLTERISRCVSSMVNVCAVKLKAAGKSIAMTLIVSKEEFIWAAPIIGRRQQKSIRWGIMIDHGLDVLAPKPCSEYFTPPAKKHMPRTSTDIMVMNIIPRNKMIVGCLRKLLRIDPTTIKIIPSNDRQRRCSRGDSQPGSKRLPADRIAYTLNAPFLLHTTLFTPNKKLCGGNGVLARCRLRITSIDVVYELTWGLHDP